MTAPMATERWTTDCSTLRRLLGHLETDGSRLVERASIPVADGFPAGSGLEGSSGGGHGDAVGELVAGMLSPGTDRDGHQVRPATGAGSAIDPLAAVVSVMTGHVRAAVRSLHYADLARRRAIDLQQLEAPSPDGPAKPCCVNCWRYDVWSQLYQAGRCEACYMYRRRNDRDAPETVVLARPEVSGKRHRVRVGDRRDVMGHNTR